MGCVSSKKKLSKADLEFLQENTEFTKEQIIEWYEGFIVSITKTREKNKISIFF
jgi:Ca2+-binding EF-hand superfamily protein